MHKSKDLLKNKSEVSKSLNGDESSELLNEFYLEHLQRVDEGTQMGQKMYKYAFWGIIFTIFLVLLIFTTKIFTEKRTNFGYKS